MNGHDERNGKNIGQWVFIGFLAIAAFFLFSEHRAHLLGALPFLLLLACPLLHFFHHRGHDGSRESDPSRRPPDADASSGSAHRH